MTKQLSPPPPLLKIFILLPRELCRLAIRPSLPQLTRASQYYVYMTTCASFSIAIIFIFRVCFVT